MVSEEPPKVPFTVSVSKVILDLHGVTLGDFQESLKELSSIFKDNLPRILPQKVEDTSTLMFIIDLSRSLKLLKGFKGFEDHVKHYLNQNEISSANFVSRLACFLANKVDDLALDPLVDESDKRGDVLVTLTGQETVIECKSILNELAQGFLSEHEHMFDILSEYLEFPHELTITYEKSLSDAELRELGEEIKRKLPSITNSGSMISRPTLDVHVTKKGGFGDKRVHGIIFGMSVDNTDNLHSPLNVIFKGGLTMGLIGPRLDSSKLLLEKLRKSRKQAPADKPFVLAIDANQLPGDYKQLIRKIQANFHPMKHTRFSGVLLVKSFQERKEIKFTFNFIRNPYAKFPVTEEFISLFSQK